MKMCILDSCDIGFETNHFVTNRANLNKHTRESQAAHGRPIVAVYAGYRFFDRRGDCFVIQEQKTASVCHVYLTE